MMSSFQSGFTRFDSSYMTTKYWTPVPHACFLYGYVWTKYFVCHHPMCGRIITNTHTTTLQRVGYDQELMVYKTGVHLTTMNDYTMARLHMQRYIIIASTIVGVLIRWNGILEWNSGTVE